MFKLLFDPTECRSILQLNTRQNAGISIRVSVCVRESQKLTFHTCFSSTIREPRKNVRAFEMLLFGRGPVSLRGGKTSSNVTIKLPAALGDNCVGDHRMSLWLYTIEPPALFDKRARIRSLLSEANREKH